LQTGALALMTLMLTGVMRSNVITPNQQHMLYIETVHRTQD
jgi:hypothetical protein